MAHVAFLYDADADRRRRFSARVRELFSELPGTTMAEAHAGPLSCLWVTGSQAPVDVSRAGDRLAVLVGYAIDDDGRWVTAGQLADSWLAPEAARRGHHRQLAADLRLPSRVVMADR